MSKEKAGENNSTKVDNTSNNNPNKTLNLFWAVLSGSLVASAILDLILYNGQAYLKDIIIMAVAIGILFTSQLSFKPKTKEQKTNEPKAEDILEPFEGFKPNTKKELNKEEQKDETTTEFTAIA